MTKREPTGTNGQRLVIAKVNGFFVKVAAGGLEIAMWQKNRATNIWDSPLVHE